ncbi:hypothetical protein POPTR_011G116501v4 [Populus trichocarpa]|uniref:Uncharacterized protein n=1 Tax=Populus trichocarpa TaxID=3694 RepID=A0ACC0S8D1_POPTR|nr:hypothetical protein POPTR_011G116501v4 [Populus trichocarpa]
MLENEENNENAEFGVKEVEYIQAEHASTTILDFRSDRSTSSKSFRKEIKKKEEEIKKKDDFIFEMKRQMDSMKEYLMNNLGYHGGTSNIDQGMSAPIAPSMPPPIAP